MQESFSAQSLVGLNWTCVTGGSTGYRPLGVEFPAAGQCRLIGSAARSVCELLQPGQLEGCRGITVTIAGQIIHQPALLGLWWNHPNPTVWSDEKIHPLPTGEKELSIQLHFDFTNRPSSGLYLLMQEGELLLTDITITAD